MYWEYPVILAGSYVVGSLSLSILASKALFGGDIRSEGSGNAGATNMARVHGWGAGLLTLAGDALKAAVCMLAGNALAGEIGLCLGAAGCMLGHSTGASASARSGAFLSALCCPKKSPSAPFAGRLRLWRPQSFAMSARRA